MVKDEGKKIPMDVCNLEVAERTTLGLYNILFLVEMSGFALGNVVYIIIEIQFQMSVTTVACSGTYGWTFVFRLAFIVTQTFFLFKNQTVWALVVNHML